jgi:alpha-maltose-1-phosphate synthase
MIANVTVSHPHGNPNSYYAARAFSDVKRLRSFESGFIRDGFALKLIKMLLRTDHRARSHFDGLPFGEQNQHFIWETTSQVGKRIKAGGPVSRVSWYDVLFCGHDWQVSKTTSWDVDAVYAYEDCSRLTFRTAKRRNVSTVYELPAGYYQGVTRELTRAKVRSRNEPSWKIARKDEELQLADIIVVPCKWARESLNYSNVESSRPVITVPYGTPADEMLARTQSPRGPFTILFAGQISVRKGIPCLLEAWERLALKDAQLWLAGSMSLSRDFFSRRLTSCEYLGALPRFELMHLMKQVDLFVLPSLAEGFGLVIGEAMAAGVPVLTTTNTGGPELITDGKEGWCVPAHDVDALAERIKWAYSHRDELYQIGKNARRRAEQWTWTDYRRKLIDELSVYL